jgi:hypothetical protein
MPHRTPSRIDAPGKPHRFDPDDDDTCAHFLIDGLAALTIDQS